MEVAPVGAAVPQLAVARLAVARRAVARLAALEPAAMEPAALVAAAARLTMTAAAGAAWVLTKERTWMQGAENYAM